MSHKNDIQKVKITEKDAAYGFCDSVFGRVSKWWPTMLDELKNFPGENVSVMDEDKAITHLALAIIAMDLISLKNLSSFEVSERILDHIIEHIINKTSQKTDANLIKNEVKDYQTKLAESIWMAETVKGAGHGPFDSVAEKLLEIWFGDTAKFVFTKTDNKFISPSLTQQLSIFLMDFLGGWKEVLAKYELEK